MRELSLLVSVVLCLPTLARAQTQETIIPAGSLLECTLEEPNFSSASAEVGDPLICHTRGVQEFGRAVFARAAYLAGHLAQSKEPGHFWGKGSLKLEFDRISLPDTTLPVPGKIFAVQRYRVDRQGEIIGHGHPRRDAIVWMIPPLRPWKIVSLPSRGPRPTLKGETEITLRSMDDVEVPLATAASRPAAGQPAAPPTTKTWISYSEAAGRDGTIQVEVVETGSGVSVQKTWTGGDGAMRGTVIVAWFPYGNIGKIDLGPPVGKGDQTWTVHVESANTPLLQKIDSPERKTASRTLPEIHDTTRIVMPILSSRIQATHMTPMRIFCTTSS